MEKNKIIKKNIVLIGMPGAGKTSVAMELAESLKDFEVIDTDYEIQIFKNMSISNIFKSYGEEYFRKLEANLIEKLSLQSNKVISVGGGAFEFETNRKNLAKNSLIFFMECKLDVIYDRIKSEKTRPLLTNKDFNEILTTLYKIRLENYLKADFRINADSDINTVKNEILKVYNNATNND